MKTYAEKRYQNSKLSDTVIHVINDMNKNTRLWKCLTKTNMNREVRGTKISLLRNFYSSDNPVSLFINQVEIETLTEKEMRILVAEFGYFRERVERDLKIKNAQKKKVALFS